MSRELSSGGADVLEEKPSKKSWELPDGYKLSAERERELLVKFAGQAMLGKLAGNVPVPSRDEDTCYRSPSWDTEQELAADCFDLAELMLAEYKKRIGLS